MSRLVLYVRSSREGGGGGLHTSKEREFERWYLFNQSTSGGVEEAFRGGGRRLAYLERARVRALVLWLNNCAHIVVVARHLTRVPALEIALFRGMRACSTLLSSRSKLLLTNLSCY